MHLGRVELAAEGPPVVVVVIVIVVAVVVERLCVSRIRHAVRGARRFCRTAQYPTSRWGL